MPQLDTMLEALADRDAEELVLAEGARPAFRYADGDRPCSQVVLNRAQILALLTELVDEERASLLRSGHPGSFGYALQDGRSFHCEAGGENGDFAARVTFRRPGEEPVASCSDTESARIIDGYLRRMMEVGASDLHLSANERPMLRADGEMSRMEGEPPCSPDQTLRLLSAIMPPRNSREFEQISDTDFAYELPGGPRFRVNVFADRKGAGAVFRIIPNEIPSMEDLGLAKVLYELCSLPKGLVLVTGPTGSGKSTTLAAMIDYINRTRSDHIVTIEDPIEFVHDNKNCLINQREVGTHTGSFKRALRAALREDPDIVLVGEMRDLETVEIAIETAETGHLVFGTLHTSTAASTVDRVIDQFPPDRQDQIRTMLSESLKGVISQTLLKKIGGGRVAAMEILIGIPAISNLIREGKTFQIPSIMQTGKKHGMSLLNDSLVDLVRRRVVAPDEAYRKSVDKSGIANQLRETGFQAPSVGG